MARKKLSREKIINAFLTAAFDSSAGSVSLQDISDILQVKKASLYNHFASRDALYAAVLAYCREYLDDLNFLPDDMFLDGSFLEEDIFSVVRKIFRRYILLFENEPLFQIYVFIHTEQYFCADAYRAVDAERAKVQEGIFIILESYAAAGKIQTSGSENTRLFADWYASAFLQQLDIYIMRKKETVRQNPVCGAGSLFSMPSDESALEEILKLAEGNWGRRKIKFEI
ncbi:MAG: TetR/AcrR family transcriptional regulator [Treponema sp.]